MEANGTPRAGGEDLHDAIEAWQAEIARLQAEIEELKRRLPRHSVPPAMLLELEEELDRAKEAAKNAQSYGSR
jgi:cell division septum initiation protein DivIVA